MKNRVLTNSLRAVRKNLPRFISLLTMSMLGVFVFVGLRATAPDMMQTLDMYLDGQNTYDLKIVSTMGLTDEDVQALQKTEGVADAEGCKQADAEVTLSDSDFVIRFFSLPERINTLRLLSGRLPERQNEAAVDPSLLEKTNLKLGDTVTLTADSLKQTEFTVVGTVDSSLYFNNTTTATARDRTSIGTGDVKFYAFIPTDCFTEDYYRAVYLTAQNAASLITASADYQACLSVTETAVQGIKEAQQQQRYDALYQAAEQTISQNRKKAEETLNKAQAALTDNKNELDKAAASLAAARSTLSDKKKQLNEAAQALDEANAAFAASLEQYNLQADELDKALADTQAGIEKLQGTLQTADPSANETSRQTLEALYQRKQLLLSLIAARDKIAGQQQAYQQGLSLYNDSLSTYRQNEQRYQNGMADYRQAEADFNRQKSETEQKLADAQKELDALEHPKWTVYTREDYSTYKEYTDDTDSIRNLAKIFPIIFFLVAVLVSLISMNRMVEEDRGEIGTLKSLGFSGGQIAQKYLLFSLLATLAGGAIGCAGGAVIIPRLIAGIYTILFELPKLHIILDLPLAAAGTALSALCVCGTTALTVGKVLREKPSSLMRPKAPRGGKRILLERIRFLWNRLPFSGKVTLRNLFRYKKRGLVTVIGVAGCSALILCGFGLKDSIVNIPEYQYGRVFTFDGLAYTDGFKDEYFAREEIESLNPVQSLSADDGERSLTLMVGEDFSGAVSLRDAQTGDVLSLSEGGVIITDKYAALSGKQKGDTLTLTDVDGRTYRFTVSAVAECYVGHYVFITRSAFEAAGGQYKTNLVYFKTGALSDSAQNRLSSALLQNEHILSVQYVGTMIGTVENMLKSLDKVVLILIVLASLLSFVVLYNLSVININERRREIATLKVLGFYENEVDAYITGEAVLLTVLGIVFGLIFGYFMTNAIISTVEIEKARFIHEIKPLSFVLAALMSLVFTVVVNFVTHFSLKRINMTQSLKSVE